jgi:hypothetical protein
MKEITSSTGKTTRSLMSQAERMKKVKLLSFGASTVELTRDGKSSISTKPRRFQLKDSTKNSDSTSTDHSTLSQDSH